MSNKPYIASKGKPLWSINKKTNSGSTKIPSNNPADQTNEKQDKSREQQIKWHPSKLEGFISNEFRHKEFAD